MRRNLRRRPLYSACNEDTRTEIHALAPAPTDTVVCIAAGGGRALSLLAAGGGRFLAIDRSASQLHALELKAAALDALGYESYRRFLGLEPDPDRLGTYAALRGSLGAGARRYWDARAWMIGPGVLYAGRLETALAAYAAALRRAGSLDWARDWFAAPTLREQRALMRRDVARLARSERLWSVFFHPLAVFLTTRDPSFLRSTQGDVGRYLFRRFLAYARRHRLRDSFLLHLIYFGCYDPGGAVPHYLTRTGYEGARKRLARLELRQDRIECAPAWLNPTTRVVWSLSDVGGWMNAAAFDALLAGLARHSPPGSRVCYRNLAALRRPRPRAGLAICPQRSAAAERADRSVFYRLVVGEVVHPDDPLRY